MATNKIHFLSWLLFPYLYDVRNKDYFSDDAGAEVILNDAISCWTKDRALTHFTYNPSTKKTSWFKFPDMDLKEWSKELIMVSPNYNAGKVSDITVIDEATDVNEFLKLNKLNNPKNRYNSQLEHFYMHLIQDCAYDDFIKSVIDTSSKYEDKYVFQGEVMTGEELCGDSDSRWTNGLLSELDEQFYVRLAKIMFDKTGKTATKAWLFYRLEKAVKNRYPNDIAEDMLKDVTLSCKASEIITMAHFDYEVWPIRNSVMDIFVEIMFKEMFMALNELEVI